MEAFLIYSLKSGLCMGLFYSLYYLFLSNDTAHMRNRIYLLGTIALSLIIPIISLPTLPLSETSSAEGTTINAIRSIVVTVNATSGTNTEKPLLSFMNIVSVIYFTGMALFIMKNISGIIRLIRLVNRNRTDDGIVRYEGLDIAGFSAAGLIFINRKLQGNELTKVLRHETAHRKLLHYIDTFLIETILIIQWMNPFAYLIRHSLRAVHEYQADKYTIDSPEDIPDYQQLLLKEIIGTDTIALASCFSSFSLLKKRFIMMTKKETKRGAALKLLMALPVITLALMIFSCQEEVEVLSLEEKAVETIGEKKEPFTFQRILSFNIDTTYKDGELYSLTITPKEKGEMITFSSKEEARDHQAAQVQELIKAYVAEATEKQKEAASISAGPETPTVPDKRIEGDEIFFIVEDQPKFQGGDMTDFSRWVQQQVEYPKVAQENRIQGRVVVGFVIEPDGTVSNVEVMRSVDKLLDDEAVRVVASSPKWEPGRQRGIAVRVRFTIHVNFQMQ